MRDIVATIQPEQDEIVRGRARRHGVRAGRRPAPGRRPSACTGWRICCTRTASGWPAPAPWSSGRTRPSSTTSSKCCPPSASWQVKQATVDDLVAMCEVRGTDDAGARPSIKGDARMAEVLRRAVRSHVTAARPSRCVVVRGSRRWRVPAYELEEIVRELLDRDIRYGAAREALPQRIAHAVLVQMERSGEAPDDRVQDAVARNAAVKAAVKAVWPPVDPAKLVLRLLSDAGLPRRARGRASSTRTSRRRSCGRSRRAA